jgi:hypothetical protein
LQFDGTKAGVRFNKGSDGLDTKGHRDEEINDTGDSVNEE